MDKLCNTEQYITEKKMDKLCNTEQYITEKKMDKLCNSQYYNALFGIPIQMVENAR